MPRKLVISYKQQPGTPRYEARLSHWQFFPRLADHAFTFDPPKDASEIEFLPTTEEQIEPNEVEGAQQ